MGEAAVVGAAGTGRSGSGLTATDVRGGGTGEMTGDPGATVAEGTVMDPAELLGAESTDVVRAEPDNAEPDNADPDNGEPDNTEPDNAEPDNAEPDNAEPDHGGGAGTASPPRPFVQAPTTISSRTAKADAVGTR